MSAEEAKKDLTSLFELSQKEINQPAPEAVVETQGEPPALEGLDLQSLEPAAENDFSLDEPISSMPEVLSTETTPSDPDPAQNQAISPPVSDEHTTPEGNFFTVTPLDESGAAIAPQDPDNPELASQNPQVPSTQNEMLSQVRDMAEKISIGHSRAEANPPFHFYATNSISGRFNEKQKKRIEEALKAEDYGIRYEDVEVQLELNRFFVPRISEFAAVSLAQHLRDSVENIEIYPATGDAPMLDSETFSKPDTFTDARDFLYEPQTPEEIFSTNLQEVAQFEITKVICVLTVSATVSSEIAENMSSSGFEQACNKLNQELIRRAFNIKAHGLVGISFNLLPLENKSHGKRYRLLATATAVQAKRLPESKKP